MDKIQMDILGLSTSPSSGGAYALILSEVDGSRRLPIIIGTYEAQAIALELEHIKPPRPMTHDLLKQMIETLDSSLKYVWINELREGTFYSRIILDNNGRQVEADSRPSDAIALAIRFNAPIFVSSQVLDEAGISSESVEVVGDSGESDHVDKPSDADEPAKKDKSTRLQLLEKNLATAIQSEDYELAAKLRDEIQRLKGEL